MEKDLNENFIKLRDELLSTIRANKMTIDLINASGASRNTVKATFEVTSPTQLAGQKFQVWKTAIALINEKKKLVSAQIDKI